MMNSENSKSKRARGPQFKSVQAHKRFERSLCSELHVQNAGRTCESPNPCRLIKDLNVVCVLNFMFRMQAEPVRAQIRAGSLKYRNKFILIIKNLKKSILLKIKQSLTLFQNNLLIFFEVHTEIGRAHV